MKAFIAIPTYNAGVLWEKVAKNIRENSPPDTLVQIIDSGSSDNTIEIAQKYSFEVTEINSLDFNHGGTRNDLVSMHAADFDIVIFLTQDAIPQPDFYENIVKVFDNEKVACAYGRQLPHDDANALSKHARYFNYSDISYKADINSISTMGLKTVFSSNSFCAYRISNFISVGGFPKNTILSEDMYFAAKSILKGYDVIYTSESMVKHSHNYSVLEEYRRYFDIGVFQKQESWIKEKFGGAGGEGRKFIISEFLFLKKMSPLSIPVSVVHNFAKLVGYKLGQNYKLLPSNLVKAMSMHKKYWR